MNLSRYNLELDTTSACTKRLTEETKVLGQRAMKCPTMDCFLFDSGLLSKNAVESAAYIAVDLIGMVKTNIKGFCKATIEGLTKDCTGGFYIVLRRKPMVPKGRMLLAIG